MAIYVSNLNFQGDSSPRTLWGAQRSGIHASSGGVGDRSSEPLYVVVVKRKVTVSTVQIEDGGSGSSKNVSTVPYWFWKCAKKLWLVPYFSES